MPLSPAAAVEQAQILHGYHLAERPRLEKVRQYWKGRQALPAVIPSSAPREVRTLALIARVNVCSVVVDTLTQSSFVDGFRSKDDADDAEVWTVWQANRMDRWQTGIHRAAYGYGASYGVVLPGDPYPVMRGASPRNMTAVYGEDPDWPLWALERLGRSSWKLYDGEAVYFLAEKRDSSGASAFEHTETRAHDLGVTPVVRFLDEVDLDADDDVASDGLPLPMRGQVAPLFPLQDQIDLTTFGLLVAQHYSAFRQRYILGWTADDENASMKAAASQLWTFDVDANEVKVGEFEQTDLKGYIDSREASLRHAATLSQTPVHELTGTLVNMAAEALAAAEKGHERKLDERKTGLGESHEQMMWLVGRAAGIEVPDDAEVRWRDTSARAFGAVVDGLGKLATMLGIPPQELWERIPGVTPQDVERWKAAADQGDPLTGLTDMLGRQSGPDPADIKAKADAMGVLIRSGATPESAAALVGLAGMEFTGAVPTSLRLPESDAAELEQVP